MDQISFLKKWINVIQEALFQKLMRNAISLGFSAPGFTSRSKHFPRAAAANLNSKSNNREKNNYEIILQVIKILSKEEPVDPEIEMAQKWIDDENSRKEIENKINNIIDDKKEEKEEKNVINNDDVVDNQANEKIEKLMEENAKLLESKKELKQKNNEQKIKYDNLEKNFNTIVKLNRSNEKTIEELGSKLREVEAKNVSLKDEINEKNKMIELLNEQNKELYDFKDNAPMILCIGVSSLDTTGGFNIQFENEWNDEVKEKYIGERFFEIWVIGNIEYYKMIELKQLFTCKIISYKNKKHVYDRLGR